MADLDGLSLSGVAIALTNAASGASYHSVSNAVGGCSGPNVPSGNYRIQFERENFKKNLRGPLELSVTQVLRVDVVRQLGALSESIEVHDAAPLLQTETPEVGTVLDGWRVNDLPLGFAGGRYAENFAYKLADISGSPALRLRPSKSSRFRHRA